MKARYSNTKPLPWNFIDKPVQLVNTEIESNRHKFKTEKILRNLRIKCTIGTIFRRENIILASTNNECDLLITITSDSQRNKFIYQLDKESSWNILKKWYTRETHNKGRRNRKISEATEMSEIVEMSKFKTRTPRVLAKPCGEVASFAVSATSRSCRLRLRHVDPLTFRRSFDVYRINLPAYSLKFTNTRRHVVST